MLCLVKRHRTQLHRVKWQHRTLGLGHRTRDRARSLVRERVVLESTEAKDARDRLKAVELLGQLAEFDLFAGKKADSTIRHEVRKTAEQGLRAVIERVLARDAAGSCLRGTRHYPTAHHC